MKKIRLLISYLLLLGLFSIPFVFPSELNAQVGGKTLGDKLEDNPNDDEKLCNPNNREKYNKFCEYYKNYKDSTDTNNVKAAEYRNRMIDLLKVQIDDHYNDHKNGRVTHTKWFQTILDILGVGLAFTGNIVGGLRTKTVLAATSGSFQAGRNSVNDRFHLLQQQILINKMNSNRLDQWAKIIDRKKLDINDFSWDNAKAELQQYLFRGSFTDALDSLVEQTGAQVQISQTNLTNVVLKAVSQNTLAAKLQNFNGYFVPMNSMGKKLDADIEVKKAEIQAAKDAKPLVQADIDKKTTEKVELEVKKTNLLENYKNIFTAIVASGDLDDINKQLRAKYSETSTVMTPYDKVFQNLITNPSVITFDDYDKTLASINEFAVKDVEMNKRFLAILQLYKI
jgi:hypothetical protein